MAGYASHGHGLMRVIRKADGVAVGMCGVLKRDTLPDADLGFSFFRSTGRRATRFESAAPS